MQDDYVYMQDSYVYVQDDYKWSHSDVPSGQHVDVPIKHLVPVPPCLADYPHGVLARFSENEYSKLRCIWPT